MSVVTRASAQSQADTIRDETQEEANTALRVGGLLRDITDSVAFISEISATILATALFDSNVGTLSGLTATGDGVTLSSDGDVAFLTNQSDARENGPWVVHSGPWTRPAAFQNGSSADGRMVHVLRGSTYADQTWVCTTDAPNDIVGTNNLTFVFNVPTWSDVLSNGSTSGANNPSINSGQHLNFAGEISIRRQNAARLTSTSTATTLLAGTNGTVNIANSSGAFKLRYDEANDKLDVASGVPLNWPTGEISITKAGSGRLKSSSTSTIVNAASGGAVNLTINDVLFANAFDDTGGSGLYGLSISGNIVGTASLIVTAPSGAVAGPALALRAAAGGTGGGAQAGGTVFTQPGAGASGGAAGANEMRDSAGTARVQVSASNEVALNAATTLTLQIADGTEATLNATTLNLQSNNLQTTGYLDIGSSVSDDTDADIKVGNATTIISARNAAGNGNLDVLATNASDEVEVGDLSGGAIITTHANGADLNGYLEFADNGGAPATPGAGDVRAYSDSGTLSYIDPSGVTHSL